MLGRLSIETLSSIYYLDIEFVLRSLFQMYKDCIEKSRKRPVESENKDTKVLDWIEETEMTETEGEMELRMILN